MKEKETRNPSREQLAFPDFKTRDGESANETNKRMNEFMDEILEKYKGKELKITSPLIRTTTISPFLKFSCFLIITISSSIKEGDILSP